MLHDWLPALAGAPWVYLVLFALATIDGIFPPLPSESVVIALAALSVSTGAPNLALVLLAAAAGAFTGDQIAYAVGGRIDVRRVRILRNPRGQRTVNSAERALARRGPSFILAARFVPVGRMAVNLTAGAVRYPRRRFVGLTALAAVAWSLYSALIGLLAGAWIQDQPLLAITVGIVGGLLSGLALDWGLRRRRTPGDRSGIQPGPRDLDLPARRRRPERRDGIPLGEVQLFLGKAATTAAAAQDHASEVPPPNGVWICNVSHRLRTLPVAPTAPITVNVLSSPVTGSSTKDLSVSLTRLGQFQDLKAGALWLTVRHGAVTRIAEQYLP